MTRVEAARVRSDIGLGPLDEARALLPRRATVGLRDAWVQSILRRVTHLLIRGIGLCGATGEIDVTLEPDDTTCPTCRAVIGMLREKERNVEAPLATALARLQLAPAMHYFAGGRALCGASGNGRWTIVVDSVTCAACTEKLSGAAADLSYTRRLLERYADLREDGAAEDEPAGDLPVPPRSDSCFARVRAWIRRLAS
jgi:hypothetical protein